MENISNLFKIFQTISHKYYKCKFQSDFLTVRASQRDTVLSAEHVIRVLENGRNSMLLTESVWPRRVYRQRRLQIHTHKLLTLVD